MSLNNDLERVEERNSGVARLYSAALLVLDVDDAVMSRRRQKRGLQAYSRHLCRRRRNDRGVWNGDDCGKVDGFLNDLRVAPCARCAVPRGRGRA